MGFLDLIEQENSMRLFRNRLGQQAALIKTHITGRRSDKTRYRVSLHILRHIKANQFNTKNKGELTRHLGLADAGWSRKQERTNWLFRFTKTRSRHLDCRSQGFDRRILTKDCVGEVTM